VLSRGTLGRDRIFRFRVNWSFEFRFQVFLVVKSSQQELLSGNRQIASDQSGIIRVNVVGVGRSRRIRKNTERLAIEVVTDFPL
jgi:hypothetical protein